MSVNEINNEIKHADPLTLRLLKEFSIQPFLSHFLELTDCMALRTNAHASQTIQSGWLERMKISVFYRIFFTIEDIRVPVDQAVQTGTFPK